MSWLDIDPESDFSIANIPFGVISSSSSSTPRTAIAIGDYALDLQAFAQGNGFSGSSDIVKHQDVFSQPTLNAFAALGRPFHRQVREYLQSILSADTKQPELLKDNDELKKTALLPLSEIKNHLPMQIGDYTDFYAGKIHAVNLGTILRGAANSLQPNYTHLPVAYHGRASSVVISGTPITRPWGQILEDPKAEPKVPSLLPSRRLDLELEMAMFLCKSNPLGKPIKVDEAEEYIFGYALLNDWSARDLQAWEYVPLGPFTAKNFATSVSPWIVLADTAIPKTPALRNHEKLLPYLEESKEDNVLSLRLTAELITAKGSKKQVTRTNSKYLMWSWPQMIAHHTISGCSLQPGDLFGSGTISGPYSYGSLFEQTAGGREPFEIGSEERTFLEDGDTLVIRGWTGDDGQRIGFGEVSGTIEPAHPLF